jgi:hypothetical protein
MYVALSILLVILLVVLIVLVLVMKCKNDSHSDSNSKLVHSINPIAWWNDGKSTVVWSNDGEDPNNYDAVFASVGYLSYYNLFKKYTESAPMSIMLWDSQPSGKEKEDWLKIDFKLVGEQTGNIPNPDGTKVPWIVFLYSGTTKYNSSDLVMFSVPFFNTAIDKDPDFFKNLANSGNPLYTGILNKKEMYSFSLYMTV